MRTAYRVLAYVIVAEVVLQAAAVVYAVFGLFKYIDDGAVVDKATQESGVTFEGVTGFIVHGINGMMVIPALALILLVVSFFAKVPKGSRWAGIVFGLVVLQVLLGGFAHGLPILGALHGANALALFGAAAMAAHRARPPRAVTRAAEAGSVGLADRPSVDRASQTSV